MSWFEKKHHKPIFRRPLVAHPEFKGSSSLLLKDRKQPDLVVRETPISKFRNAYGDESISAPDAAQVAKKMFDELRDTYGVECPILLAVGPNENGEECIYSSVDAVRGVPFEKLSNDEKRDYAGELYRVREASLRYYEDKILGGNPFLGDIIKRAQYAYGKRAEDMVNKMYMIDGDPIIFQRMNPAELRQMLMLFEYSLVDEINTFNRYKDFRPLYERWEALRKASGIDNGISTGEPSSGRGGS